MTITVERIGAARHELEQTEIRAPVDAPWSKQEFTPPGGWSGPARCHGNRADP